MTIGDIRDTRLVLNQLGPIRKAVDYTCSDTVDCPPGVRAVMFPSDGDAMIWLRGDDAGPTVVFKVLVGVIYSMEVKRILATGTTASAVKLLF